MEDRTEALIELLRKTIEQKDGQIEELRGTVQQLQATIAGLNETHPCRPHCWPTVQLLLPWLPLSCTRSS